MAMIMIPSKLRVLNNEGKPAVGWKLYTYIAGTTTLKDTWIDEAETVANTNPVVFDIRGEAIVRLSGSYKIKLTDENDVEIWTLDNQTQYDQRNWSGLTATIVELNATNTSSVAKTADYPITLTDRGKTILVDATAATPTTITLLNATTATNGYQITIKKTDLTTNLVNIDAVSSQKVDGIDPFVLYDYNDFVKLLSDGSNWHLIAGKIRGSAITKTSTPFAPTLSDEKNTYLIDASSGAFAVNLPATNTLARGYSLGVKKIDSTGNAVTITPDGSETVDGAANVILIKQYDFLVLKTDGTNWFVIGEYGSEQDDALPQRYIAGLLTVQDTDADHDIKFNAGECRDADNALNILLSSTIVKRIDANWVAGTGNGGFPSALTLSANTWYHLFVIGKTDGTVDAGYDSDISATNLLADATGYTGFRRVGSIVTDATVNITDYRQGTNNNDFFHWDEYREDVTATNPGTALQTPTMSCPPGVEVYLLMTVFLQHSTSSTGASILGLKHPGTNDQAVAQYASITAKRTSTDTFNAYSPAQVLTNILQQINYKLDASVGDTVVLIYTQGWIDPRGK